MRSAPARFAALMAVLAVVLASCGGQADQSSSGLPADGVHYRWEAGDCVFVESRAALPHEPFGSAVVVDCEEEHALEVFFTGDVEGGDDDLYPDDLVVQTWETCAAAFHGYVGAHLSETSLDITVYRPDRSEWAGGLRYQTCLVEDPGSGGDPSLTTGSLRGAADRVPSTVTAGQCFDGRSVLGPTVACTEPHLAEAIGRFTHPGGIDAPWPGSEEVRSTANDGCASLLGEYATGGGDTVTVSPIAFTRPLSRSEWEDGLRSIECAALVFDSDRHHVEVVGSLSDPDWSVVGAGQAV